jgi:hypothetical protein
MKRVEEQRRSIWASVGSVTALLSTETGAAHGARRVARSLPALRE